VRYLWLTAGLMTLLGICIAASSAMAGVGPIAFVCGLLLFWSGIVKLVVLRIWQKTLAHPPIAPDRGAHPPHSPS
jgi:hypothetical protein